MTESTERPTATEQDVPGVTTQVTQNDVGSAEDLAAAYEESLKAFEEGDIVDGYVVKVDRDEVLLDIGYKSEGVIPSRELSIKHDVDPNEVVSLGDHIEALVMQKEDKDGRLILSKKRAQYERAWGTIEKKKENDEIVEGTVIEVVKGGLILDIGLRGFLPASLVEMRRVRDLHPYVGRTLEAKIIELDKNRNNVVLSRRAWLEETQSATRRAFLHTLRKGEVRKGVVSSIVNFGAFVDLGGVDGLVHVSELSWKHIDHPSEVVEVGQEVEVEVLDVDLERERVSLSLKATQEDPWRQFARSHQIGELIPGRVTKLVPFGAFVRVDDGIEGLVHISELAERHVDIPEQVVSVGEEITVKVIDIDLDRRRISLSLKQAAQDQAQLTAPEDELALEEGAYQCDEGEYAEGPYVEGAYAEGEYADGSYVYDEQGNPIGVMPGTAMAEAFQEAGFYEGTYDAEGAAEGQPAEGQPAEGQPAEAQRPGRRGRGSPRRPRPATPARRRRRATTRSRTSSRTSSARTPASSGPGRPTASPARRPVSGNYLEGAADMLLVGLTGGIASGKSTVSAMLAERGAEVIDADHIARQVVLPGMPAWCKIRDHFGPGVLHPDGQIDRQALADIVFADNTKLALLNEITHPAIFARIADRLEAHHDQDVVVVLDAALLIEAGLAEGVDVVIVTHSPHEIQVERLAAKGVGERDASNRIAAQLEPEKRLARADIVIDNSGSLEKLGRRVDEVWEELQGLLAARTGHHGDRRRS